MSEPAWFVIERFHGRLIYSKTTMNPANMRREDREGKRFLRLDPQFQELDLDTLIRLYERGADISEPIKPAPPAPLLTKPPGTE